jgi:hypothetical protein
MHGKRGRPNMLDRHRWPYGRMRLDVPPTDLQYDAFWRGVLVGVTSGMAALCWFFAALAHFGVIHG